MIDSSEMKWLWKVSIIISAVFSIPYLFGYSVQGDDLVFTGFVFGVMDGNSYIAKMLQGANGAWLFKTPYTVFPQTGILAFIPYLLLGKLSAPPAQHEQLVALFQCFRIIATFLLVFASYHFLAMFIQSHFYRRVGTILHLVGGGLGWISLFIRNGAWIGMPVEFYSPEAFGFLMVYGLPHLAFARGLMLLGLIDYLDGNEAKRNWKSGFKTLILWLLVGLMQPIYILVGWIAIAAYTCFQLFWTLKQQKNGKSTWDSLNSLLQRGVWVGTLSSPLLLYTMGLYIFDPFFKAWSKQNLLTSPPIADYLLAYALLCPLAILGIGRVFTRSPRQSLFIFAWLAIIPVMIYLPISYQRRLIDGAWICLIALTLVWLENKQNLGKRIAYGLVALSLIPTALFVSESLSSVLRRESPVFRHSEEVRAFLSLANQARPGDVVLASNEVSNAVPAWAPVTTMVGHGPESINGLQLTKEIKAFYQPDFDMDERIRFLARHHVRFLFYGPIEQGLGDWNPSSAKYLIPVFQSQIYSVFEVRPRTTWRQNEE